MLNGQIEESSTTTTTTTTITKINTTTCTTNNSLAASVGVAMGLDVPPSVVTNDVDQLQIDCFINDLKEAIQQTNIDPSKSHDEEDEELVQQEQSLIQLNNTSNLFNFRNLSTQTFIYIINWLKQQQQRKRQLENNLTMFNNDQIISSSNNSSYFISSGSMSALNYHRNGGGGAESSSSITCFDRDKLILRLRELQDENSSLKLQLNDLKLAISASSQSSTLAIQQQAASTLSLGNNNTGQQEHLISIVNENKRLNMLVDKLEKQNDEKSKHINELTKQVHRFKRIQEIVTTAQNPNPNTSIRNKSMNNEIEFDSSLDSTNNNNNKSNSNILNQANQLNNETDLTNSNQQLKQPSQQQNNNNNNNTTNMLISSCSLSSSLSSSSSSTSTSSIITNNNATSANCATSAPLATISELGSYNSPKTMAKTSSIALQDQQLNTSTTNNQSIIKDIVNNAMMNNNNNNRANNKKSSVCSLNGQDSSADLPQPEKNNIEIKYLSSSSINAPNGNNSKLISSLMLSSSNNNKSRSTQKTSNSLNTSKSNGNRGSIKKLGNSTKSSPSHQQQQQQQQKNQFNTMSKASIRNFFGKLMRTSLININESSSSSGYSSASLKTTTIAPLDSTNLELDLSRNIESNGGNSNVFKRGGYFRSTANARLQTSVNSLSNKSSLNTTPVHQFSNNQKNKQTPSIQFSTYEHVNGLIDTFAFAEWSSEQVYEWLIRNGFDSYFTLNADGVCINNKWIKNGLHLLQATQFDYEKELGIKNQLHRKRLSLLLQSLFNSYASSYNVANSPETHNMSLIDNQWVIKWLDDIGLPQYKDVFHECMIDGLMLHHLSNEDFQTLNINSELHYLSIKRAIHVLRLNSFDPQCLRRRPSGDDILDKSEVMLWTNHRVMEWLRSIDLSEYAPNLRGSGVHGGLMVFETRFNSTVLADILSIPTSKTLLRRHLNSLFIDLIGPTMTKLKKDAESQSGYQMLSASSKVKHSKRNSGVAGIFSHKRTKSQDSRDFLSPPIVFTKPSNNISSDMSIKINRNKFVNNNKNNERIYSDANNLTNNNNDSYKVKLSIVSPQQQQQQDENEINVPTSIV